MKFTSLIRVGSETDHSLVDLVPIVYETSQSWAESSEAKRTNHVDGNEKFYSFEDKLMNGKYYLLLQS